MSEKELPIDLPVPEQPQTAGQLLREAREAAGLHVAALASALKVPVSKLEALEADDYAVFPDKVFMRALASSACRSLRLDSAQILDKLPRIEPKGFVAQGMQLNAPIKERPGAGAMGGSSNAVSRKALGSVLALLLAAAVVYFLPHGVLDNLMSQSEEGSSSSVVHQSVEVVPPAAATAAQLPEAAAVEPSQELAAQIAPESAAQLPVAAPSEAVPPASTAAQLPAAPAPSAAVPATAPTPAVSTDGALLVFHVTGESWVQVTDAKGVKLLDRTLAAGETVRVAANAPLSVVIGRADLTTLQVRGKAFDLAAVSRNNVARFEVKE